MEYFHVFSIKIYFLVHHEITGLSKYIYKIFNFLKPKKTELYFLHKKLNDLYKINKKIYSLG